MQVSAGHFAGFDAHEGACPSRAEFECVAAAVHRAALVAQPEVLDLDGVQHAAAAHLYAVLRLVALSAWDP